MSTAVALRDVGGVELRATTNLGQWAEEAKQAASVAVSLAQTPFVPASLRDRDPQITAANITAAILTGQELGLEPMAALRSIDVIQGTPALRAVALRAVVFGAGHDIWVAESTATRAIVRGRRRGSEQTQESVWTIDRARGLGLVGKDNWKKQPAAMLIARATSECARLIAADALLGVPYTVEEIDDGALEDAPATPGGETQRPRRTAQRRTAPRAEPVVRPPVASEPQRADPEPSFGDEPTEVEGITEPQKKKLHALYREAQISERADRLAHASGVVGRELSSSSDLTKHEAGQVIEELERAKAAPVVEDPPWPEQTGEPQP